MKRGGGRAEDIDQSRKRESVSTTDGRTDRQTYRQKEEKGEEDISTFQFII